MKFRIDNPRFHEVTRSMRIALDDLALDHLWVLHPGPHTYPVHEKITVWAMADLARLPGELRS